MKWFIGTSGWSYNEWRGIFYPKNVPARQWLSYYAEHFKAVEINNTFYNAPTIERLSAWEDIVAPRFTFAVKAPRVITHYKKLENVGEDVAAFMKIIQAQKKTGPVLFQLPPSFSLDTERLQNFLKLLPDGQRFTIEFRHPSWYEKVVYELLRERNVAFCLFEKGKQRSPRIVTADFSYVRLHGRLAGYKGDYSDEELGDWHQWLRDQNRDTYVFFDNTAENTAAIRNAQTLQKLAKGE
jgi:uncharacterized protein YecE (DUF72 family)